MSGGALPAGSMDAALAPGRNIAKGIEQFGNNVWGMIEQYKKSKAEREFASGELEGLISQFVPLAQGPPTGETGGPDVDFLAKMVGEKNVKKFVEGKATTADMLAMTHSIKTAQAQKDKEMSRQIEGLNLQLLQGQLKNHQRAAAQPDIITKAVEFAQQMPTETITSTPQPPIVIPAGEKRSELSPMFQLPGQAARPMDSMLKEVRPEIQIPQPPVTVTTPISHEGQRQNVLKQLLGSGASPETLSFADSIMNLAGKPAPMNVAVQQLPGNLGAVVQAGGKTEIVKPEKADPSIQARSVIGFQGLAPTEKEAIDFRKLFSDTEKAKSIVDELIAISKISGKSMDPVIRTRGESLAAQLIGPIRLNVVGPGAVTENEQKILQSIARNPTKFWSYDDNSLSALNALKFGLKKGVDETAKILGLSPQAENQTTGSKSIPMWDPVTRKFK